MRSTEKSHLCHVYEATKADCLRQIKAHEDGTHSGIDVDLWRRRLAENERLREQYIPNH
jgi:hypothetical protein